jgi:hypothetical protein
MFNVVDWIKARIDSGIKLGGTPTSIILGYIDYANLLKLHRHYLIEEKFSLKEKSKMLHAHKTGNLELLGLPLYIIPKPNFREVSFDASSCRKIGTLIKEITNVPVKAKVINIKEWKRRRNNKGKR